MSFDPESILNNLRSVKNNGNEYFNERNLAMSSIKNKNNNDIDNVSQNFEKYALNSIEGDKSLLNNIMKKFNFLENRVYNLEMELSYANSEISKLKYEKKELENQVNLKRK